MLLPMISLFSYFPLIPHGYQRTTLTLVLITIIVCLWANYSLYYVKYSEIVFICISVFMIISCKGVLSDHLYMHTAIFGVATIFVYIGTTLLMHGEQPSVGISFELLFAMFILNMKDIYRGWLFNQFVSIFAILLALCLVEFVLSSYFGISYIRGGEIYRFEGNYHYYYQGLLNIFPHYYSTGIARFQAFTEEPGLVGTLCAFLVATTEFRTHKWQVVVFVMSGVLSLSLAFYILFSVWGMFQLMMLRKFKYSILIGFVFSAFVFVFYSEFSDSIVQSFRENNLTFEGANFDIIYLTLCNN